MNMKPTYLVFIVISLFTINTNAQFSNYSKGYVVTIKKDTVHGFLKEINDSRSCRTLRFMDDYHNKRKFKVQEVYAYKRGPDTYVKKSFKRPIDILGMDGYMKLVENGRLKLYIFTYTMQQGGGMTANGVMRPMHTSIKRDYYIEKGGRHQLVKKLGFKSTMSQYFKDFPDLAKQIKNKTYKYRDLIYLVKAYNKHKG